MGHRHMGHRHMQRQKHVALRASYLGRSLRAAAVLLKVEAKAMSSCTTPVALGRPSGSKLQQRRMRSASGSGQPSGMGGVKCFRVTSVITCIETIGDGMAASLSMQRKALCTQGALPIPHPHVHL